MYLIFTWRLIVKLQNYSYGCAGPAVKYVYSAPTLNISIFFHVINMYSHGRFYDLHAFVFSVMTTIPAGLGQTFVQLLPPRSHTKYCFEIYFYTRYVLCNTHEFKQIFRRPGKTDSYDFRNCVLTGIINARPRRTTKTFINGHKYDAI